MSLPETTRLGRARLRVSSLERSLALYADVLGLEAVRADAATADLRAPGGERILTLREVPGVRPMVPGSAGLFHVAILLPARRDLALAMLRLARCGWPLTGMADHAVSEAIYLDDPDGNGLEIYADRPPASWRRAGGELRMTTDPLDVPGLLEEVGGPEPRWTGLPAGTTLGHVHLRVGDLRAAEAFYHRLIDLDITVRSYPGALFMAPPGYHHRVATNTWGGAGGPVAGADQAGIDDFELIVPDVAARSALRDRLGAAGRLAEPAPGDDTAVFRAGDPATGVQVVVRPASVDRS